MKIGVALSGGGALGAAHIGVLEALERHHIPIDAISGASAGSLIGLLYADGGLAAIEHCLAELTAHGMINTKTPLLRTPHAFFADFQEILRRHIRAKTFRDLRCRFCCVATELATGEMLLFDDGDPIPAVMASAAYPGVFPVQMLDGRVVIDGAVVRNVPADVLRARGVECVIGSSLYGLSQLTPVQRRGRMSRIQTVLRAFEIMQLELSHLLIQDCDFCFTPPVEGFKWYDFSRVYEIRDVSRAYAETQMPALLAMLDGRVASNRTRR